MQESPAFARAFPFIIFVVLTGLQDTCGEASRYWIYFAKTVVGIWLIWLSGRYVAEMRWEFSWRAVVVGVAVCTMWIGLDGYYRHWGTTNAIEAAKHYWNPMREFGGPLGCFFVVVRIAGSALVVPPLEETFYRSFLYRYIANPDFEKVPLNRVVWMSFLVTSLLFGFAHYQWLAGILCGLTYQWLVVRKGRLGEAMTAHAVTNFLLGVWVVWQCDWKFW